MLLLVCLFLILFEAVYESLYERGKNFAVDKGRSTILLISGLIEFIYRAVITLIIILGITICDPQTYFYPIAGCLLLRFALFDVIYNLIRGLDVFYFGKTKLWDRTWNWFFTRTGVNKPHFLFMFKLLSLLIGISFCFK